MRSTILFPQINILYLMCLIYTLQYFKELYKMLMYFICKAVDMAPQPIRCLWSGDNKHLKKKKKKKKKEDLKRLILKNTG